MWLFLWNPGIFQMLGRNEFALHQGFTCGKTLVRRKGAAPPCGAPVLSGIYTLRTRQKERHAAKRVFLFGFRRPRPPPPFGDFNARGRQSRPCAILRCAPNLRRTCGAAQKGRLRSGIDPLRTRQKRSTCFAGASSLSKKPFRQAEQVFRTFKKVLKTYD